MSDADRIPWRPGAPVLTEQDLAEWDKYRRERILAQQRERRRSMRRIDYYPSDAAAEIIDRFRGRTAGQDASSILNRIVAEWAAASGIK
jgi:hypothetical protein